MRRKVRELDKKRDEAWRAFDEARAIEEQRTASSN